MTRSAHWLLLGCASLSLAVAACGPLAPDASLGETAVSETPLQAGSTPAAGRAVARPTAVVRRDALTENLLLDGTVAPQEQKSISFSGRANVAEVLVKPGQTVRRGDVLVTLEAPHHVSDENLLALLDEARNRLAAAEAKLAREQAAQQERQNAVAQQSAAQQERRRQAEADATLDLRKAQEHLSKVQAGSSAAERQAAQDVVNVARLELQKALDGQTKLTAGPDLAAVRESERAVSLAQIAATRARNDLAALTAGPDPTALREAELRLQRAQTELQALQTTRPDPTLDPTVARIRHEAALRETQMAVQDAQDRINRLKQSAPAFEVQSARQRLQDAEDALAAAQSKARSLQSEASEATVSTQQAAVDRAQQALALAEARSAQVLDRPTPSELGEAREQVRQAQAAVDAARRGDAAPTATTDNSVDVAAILQTQAEIANHEQALAKTRLSAPFDGTVLGVSAKPGDVVTSNTVVLTLASADMPRVRAELSEDQVQHLGVGMAATIIYEDPADMAVTVTGTVRDIVPANDGSKRATADIQVAWPADDIPAFGSPAQVAFALRQKQGVLVVPKSAVRQVGDRATVNVQEGTRRRSVSVQLGIASVDAVEVLSGLTEGQVVVVGGSA